MKKLVLISFMIVFASGCASTNHTASVDHQFQSIKTTPEQAKAYIAELQLKKKRFKERQILAKAAAFSDPDQIAAQLENMDSLGSECKAIEDSQWASSVRHGQDFLGYENHVETMKRCFSQEKQAGITDVTTAMN